MSWPSIHRLFRLLCALACLMVSGLAMASEYHGQVMLGDGPVSGATVTATQGDKKVVAITDTQGVYSFPDLADGTWSVQVEMTGFSTLKQDVAIAPNMPAGTWDLKLLTIEQIRAAAKPVKVEETPAPEVASAAATPETPTPSAKAAPATKPVPAKAATAPDSQAAAAAMPPPPDASSEGVLINGSVNNAATSQFALTPAFGNSRTGGHSLYNGGIGVIWDNSSLDATQYSINGTQTPKYPYNTVTANFTFGGPIRIPHLLPRGPNFFISYQWQQNTTDNISSTLVPTLAQRSGNLSTGNVTPTSQALALLSFYPLPNSSGPLNYQTSLETDSHQNAVSIHLDKSIGNKNSFNGTFGLQSTRTTNPNIFSFVDTTDVLGMSVNPTWFHRITSRMNVNTTYNFSRRSNRVQSFFENRVNVEGEPSINIQGVDTDPADWGPPGLQFTSGIIGLSDQNSSFNRSETNSLGTKVTWNRIRHNISFGGDFRRQEFNSYGQSNPRGSFSFTGAAGGGTDFGDFLQSTPDTSYINYGNPDKYLRQSVYDAFLDDDWRARPELTIHAGVRWEYGAPITELKNRLVNLDVAPGFTAVAPVLASNPVGSLTGQHYPTSLMRPDKIGIAPLVGISWRPFSGSSVIVKGGYGIYHDTSVYQSIASSLALQPPLSTNLSAAHSSSCKFTISNAFILPCSSAATDTFAIDPNFRVGYSQNWQLSVQRDLPQSLQMTVTYSGVKGTRGTQQFYPNTYPLGITDPYPASYPVGFAYRTSNGNSTREAGIVQLRRRLRAGFTSTLTYTYSKSIDDDATLGGAGGIGAGATSQNTATPGTAQNWLNLSGERGLSNFDQRHLLNLQMQYTTGMGIGGRTLMSGWRGTAYKEWTVVTTIAVGTGTPENVTYGEPLPGAPACLSCIRPNLTGASIYAAPAGLHLNPAAFSAPLPGQWGDARVGAITGPNQFSLNASMQRAFRLHDRYTLTVQIDSNNALNHVTYSGWNTSVLSSTFGEPSNANTMRKDQLTMRLRF